jgi:acetyltransferase-like isoleucine patch superfamily enzyme
METLRDIRESGRGSILHRNWVRVVKFLRTPWHRLRFRRFGAGSRIDFPARVVGANAIEIGSGVVIHHNVRLEAHFTRERQTRIRIGDGTRIAPYVHIGGAGLVEIGRECGIGSFSWVTDHDHDASDPRCSVVTHKRIVIAPTVIEDGVYIGERVAILRGVRIGRGSVIGTNSVVTHDIPPYAIAIGAPARVIRIFESNIGVWRSVAAE